MDVYTDSDLHRYMVIIGDANLAPAISRFFSDDIGWIPELVIISDQLSGEQKKKIEKRFVGYKSGHDPKVRFHSQFFNAKKILDEVWPQNDGARYYDAFDPAFIVGSTLDRDFAREIGAKLLSVSYPVNDRVILNRGYAGYLGGLHLAEDTFTKLVEDW